MVLWYVTPLCTHLCDVVHDGDLELQVHEALVWVRDLIVEDILKSGWKEVHEVPYVLVKDLRISTQG